MNNKRKDIVRAVQEKILSELAIMYKETFEQQTVHFEAVPLSRLALHLAPQPGAHLSLSLVTANIGTDRH